MEPPSHIPDKKNLHEFPLIKKNPNTGQTWQADRREALKRTEEKKPELAGGGRRGRKKKPELADGRGRGREQRAGARQRLARVWNNYSIPRVEISPGLYIYIYMHIYWNYFIFDMCFVKMIIKLQKKIWERIQTFP